MSEPSKALEEKSKTKIIVALDVETAREAHQIIADLREDVGAFKIGLQLFTSAGASFVREVAQSGIKIFLDVKFHDIPNTVAKASVEVTKLNDENESRSGIWNLESGTIDDQKRVMTPKDAVQAGSDYLVIGRPILQATDKILAVREILEEIESE
ncbi:MAG: orotidine 5'-phosphate decarboxylase [Acidobacteria bacterium]|nr:orotidine 5'-phosphate decarboxylase [Acidobacteriota bacterium]